MTKRTILITGCSSGIGYSTALYLQKQGWRVLASCRKAEDVSRLQSEGLETLKLDVTDSEQISQAFAYIKQHVTHLDAVFCNAGYGQPGAVEDIPKAALIEQFHVNVIGNWEVMNSALAIFRAQGYGRILINSSILGFAAMHFRGAYNSSKFALEGMADTLRHELYGSKIYVSLIEPGPIQSRFRPNSLIKLNQYIDMENSVHKESYRHQLARISSPKNVNPFTLPAIECAKVCERALNSKKPKARYPVTFPTRLFGWLKRLLPTFLFDYCCRKAGN